MAVSDLESRVTELEVRLSFQDSLIEELNAVVTKQQARIDILAAKIDEIKAALPGGEEVDADAVKPPHY